MIDETIPNIIYQVWLKIDKNLADCEWAYDNHLKWKSYCQKKGFDYRLITDLNLDLYVPEKHKQFFYNLKTTFHKIDFIRYLALNQIGGIYIDLDIEPLFHHDISELLSLKYITGYWVNNKGVTEISNSVMGGRPGQFESLIDYSIQQYKSKIKMTFYTCAKVRFFKQTCGVSMYKRWAKRLKIRCTLELSKYILDHERCSWINVGLG